MYSILVKRSIKSGYGLVETDGEVLKFDTEEEAKKWGTEHIKGKSIWKMNWKVVKSELIQN